MASPLEKGVMANRTESDRSALTSMQANNVAARPIFKSYDISLDGKMIG